MSVKATASTPKPGFPRLMRCTCDGGVVLFSHPHKGVVVARGDVGHFSDKWNPAEFTDYHGTVTLENE